MFIWFWNLMGLPAGYLLVSYVSPTALASSMLYIICFSRLRMSAVSGKVTGFLASGAFAAYILNTQELVWNHFIPGRFSFLAEENALLMAAGVVGFSAAFVIASVLIDHVRQFLFRLLRVRAAVGWIESFIRGLFDEIMSKFIEKNK